MSKHTPGPWYWDSDPIKGDPLGRVRYRVVATGKTITQCYYSSSDEKSEHDARLISAAPDLLEAVRRLLAVGSVSSDVQAEVAKQARAAIAKATGEK